MKKLIFIYYFLLISTNLVFAKEIKILPTDNLRQKFSQIQGGDTVSIAPGQYRVGYVDGEEGCSKFFPWDCVLKTIPSGPDKDHPTKIIGDSTHPPQFWGTERVAYIFNLEGSSNVTIENLELTDHSECTWFGGGAPTKCKRWGEYPFGPFADYGIIAKDSSNVTLKNLNIHGFHIGGIKAGRLTDWVIVNSKIVANSFVGFDGDIDGDDANHGTIQFINTKIQFNGCGETLDLKPYNCMGQTTGGYGDGIGVGLNKEALWVFDGVDASHNTSDGIDLLYNDGTGAAIVKNSNIEGNAGNQLKTSMSTTVVNTTLKGNCDYFANENPSIVFNVDNCRALGNTLSLNFPKAGIKTTVQNSTISGNGDLLIVSSGDACNGSESITLTNDKLEPGTEFHSGEPTKVYFASGIDGNGSGPCAGIVFVQNDTPIPLPVPTPTPQPLPTPQPQPNTKKHFICEEII